MTDTSLPIRPLTRTELGVADAVVAALLTVAYLAAAQPGPPRRSWITGAAPSGASDESGAAAGAEVPAGAALSAYRIVQEAPTDVVKWGSVNGWRCPAGTCGPARSRGAATR